MVLPHTVSVLPTASDKLNRKKIIRITTVPLSLDIFCRGLLKELSEEYDVLAVSSPGPLLDKVAEREGVRTVAVPMERRPSPVKDLKALARLTRLFREERPDMVHSMTPKAGLLSMAAARLAGVPVRVHTFTGLVFPSSKGLKRLVLKTTDRITASCATHVLAEGQGIKKDIESYGITRKRVTILGHGNVRGVDMSWYARNAATDAAAQSIRRRYSIGKNAFTFAFIGRLVRDKGLCELVNAFSRLSSESDVHLFLVGEMEPQQDPLPEDVLAKIDSNLNIHSSDGWQEDIRPWLAASDAFVLPSYREGFPNTVLEAGAMGLPCIVTDINGSREIITDGVNGIIVAPKSEAELYKAMKSFAKHPMAVARMSLKSREMVAGRFEQGYVRNCLKEFYHSIL